METPTNDQVKFDYALSTNVFNDISEREKAFDKWFNKVRADAWDEGHNAGYPRVPRPAQNPYREEKQ